MSELVKEAKRRKDKQDERHWNFNALHALIDAMADEIKRLEKANATQEKRLEECIVEADKTHARNLAHIARLDAEIARYTAPVDDELAKSLEKQAEHYWLATANTDYDGLFTEIKWAAAELRRRGAMIAKLTAELDAERKAKPICGCGDHISGEGALCAVCASIVDRENEKHHENAWHCAECGCTFDDCWDRHAKILDGVKRCSGCVEREELRKELDAVKKAALSLIDGGLQDGIVCGIHEPCDCQICQMRKMIQPPKEVL